LPGKFLDAVKPKLLIIELWGVGDLAIATPFIRKASEHFDVTVLAKPFARDLQARFWPQVKIITFHAPWTAFSFHLKYNLFGWPWRAMFSVLKYLRREKFDVALSARSGDPRDHFLLKFVGAKTRLGLPRIGSQVFLTRSLFITDHGEHRYESWRIIAEAMHLNLEKRQKIAFPPRPESRVVLLHTGAAQPVRVWPLEHYLQLAKQLRSRGHTVRVLCNPEQLNWWQNNGEKEACAPRTISELLAILDTSGLFIGNDSGPGHLAAICGLPTFTFFGPQVAEWFVPLHPQSVFLEGKACPYKPCSDYCRFSVPFCLTEVSFEDAWPRVAAFVDRQLNFPRTTASDLPTLATRS
jgi:heptosyltransferase-2